MRRGRVLVTAGVAAVVLGSAVIAVLHVVGPGASISPIRRTISEYGLTSAAWAFNLAVLAIAGGSAAIGMALAITRPRTEPPSPPGASTGRTTASPIGLLLGALWVVGMVTLVAFPKANWAIGPSVSGYVHRAASLVAFIALPLAITVLLRRNLRRGSPAAGLARTAIVLSAAALAWFVPIVVAIVTVGQAGGWWMAVPLGLIERGMAVTEIVALLVLAAWTIRTARADAPAGSARPVRSADHATGATGPDLAPAGDLPVTDPAVP